MRGDSGRFILMAVLCIIASLTALFAGGYILYLSL